MKKTVSLAAVFCAAASLFAAEFGGLINSDTKFNFINNEYSEPALSHDDSLSLWFKVPLSEDGKTAFSAEALVKYSMDCTLPDADDTTDEMIADLTLFKFSTVFNISTARAVLNAGRFFYSECTGRIISQPMDALSLTVNGTDLNCSLFAGYTGLLNAKTVNLLSAYGGAYAADDKKDFYEFAVPYAVTGAGITAPYLFLNQTVTAEGFAVLKAMGPGDKDSDENRFYVTASINGPLSAIAFYTLSSTLKFNEDGNISNLSLLNVQFYPDFHSSCIELDAVYASGENGPFKGFGSLTKGTACNSASEPTYRGIIKGGLSCSIKPVSSLKLSAGASVVMDAVSSTPEYYGTEADCALVYQVFSDLSFNLKGSAFIADKKENSSTKITFSAALSF